MYHLGWISVYRAEPIQAACRSRAKEIEIMSPKLPQHGAPTASGREPGRGPSAENTPAAHAEPEPSAEAESKAKPSKIKVVYEPPRGRGLTITGVKS